MLELLELNEEEAKFIGLFLFQGGYSFLEPLDILGRELTTHYNDETFGENSSPVPEFQSIAKCLIKEK